MQRAIPVILNARTGSGEAKASLGELPALFRAAGLEAQLQFAGDAVSIAQLPSPALHEQPRLVVAGGGDRNLSAVASVLAGTEVALGIWPMGTHHHCARDLRIPGAAGAVRAAAGGR